MKYASPAAIDVKKLRQSVQKLLDLNITNAQDWCADNLHTSRRAWQQWEHGDRKMHASSWELINIKLENLK
jgi:DNA-binding transcriptional regulator YiaG